MGIRLYPNTTDVALLEQLAGVPAGTMQQLHLWEEMQELYRQKYSLGLYDDNGPEGVDVGYAFHCIVNGSDIQKLEDFLLFGWGKFYALIPAGHEEEFGSLPNGPEAIRLLQAATNFSGNAAEVSALAGGVHWG
jgi:hypothetical protein